MSDVSDLSTDQPMKPPHHGGMKGQWTEQWWEQASPEVQARRCHAHKKDGSQCCKAAMEGQRVCGTHGGRARHSVEAARRRMMEQADPAVRQLQQIAFDDTNPLEIRFKATMAIIDRVGLAPRAQIDVELSAKPYEQVYDLIEMDLGGSRAQYRGEPEEPELLPIEDDQHALVADIDADGPLDDDDVLDVEVVPDEPERGSPFESASPFAPVTPLPDQMMTLDTAISAAAVAKRHAIQRAITRGR